MLNTTQLIATHIVESLSSIPNSISGTTLDTVDIQRQHVANYVGENIDANGIDVKFQPAIVNLAKADVIDFINAQEDSGDLGLDDLKVGAGQTTESANAYRQLANRYLQSIGRTFNHSKTLV